MTSRVIILIAVATSLGCASAVLNTGVAVGVAAVRRAEGDCFIPCVPGRRCNPETGFCDKVPCRGECTEDQYCDESGVVPRCVYVRDTGLGIVRKSDEIPEGPAPQPAKPKLPIDKTPPDPCTSD